jgi:hypothetical protein
LRMDHLSDLSRKNSGAQSYTNLSMLVKLRQLFGTSPVMDVLSSRLRRMSYAKRKRL